MPVGRMHESRYAAIESRGKGAGLRGSPMLRKPQSSQSAQRCGRLPAPAAALSVECARLARRLVAGCLLAPSL
jgi:hypothetical protein